MKLPNLLGTNFLYMCAFALGVKWGLTSLMLTSKRIPCTPCLPSPCPTLLVIKLTFPRRTTLTAQMSNRLCLTKVRLFLLRSWALIRKIPRGPIPPLGVQTPINLLSFTFTKVSSGTLRTPLSGEALSAPTLLRVLN